MTDAYMMYAKDTANFPNDRLDKCIAIASYYTMEKEPNKGKKIAQKFDIDLQKCNFFASEDAKKIINDFKEKMQGEKFEEKVGCTEEVFAKKINEFKLDHWKIKVDRRITERRMEAIKKIRKDSENPVKSLDGNYQKNNEGAKKGELNKNLHGIAIGGLAVIGTLMLISIICPISAAIPGNENPCPVGVGTAASQILESNFMAVLVSAVIAPVGIRILKEKYDIDIEEKHVTSIINDGIKSVSMWQKSADRLRDENGKIPKRYQEQLRDFAFTAISENYSLEKYKDVTTKVGMQVYEKVIEDAIAKNKIEKSPLEGQQVKELLSQIIDATPDVINWKDLNEDAKTTFIDGHVRRMMQNIGVEGWADDKIKMYLDAEISNRMTAAIIADSQRLIPPGTDTPLKYTSTVAKAVIASSLKKD